MTRIMESKNKSTTADNILREERIQGFLQAAEVYLKSEDYKKALHCYELASNLGSAEASHKAGLCSLVDHDALKAMKFFELGAEREYTPAMLELGHLYKTGGSGIAKSPEMALSYYKIAAAKGNHEAVREIGTCHWLGLGTPASQEKAIEAWKKAAEKDPRAQGYLAYSLILAKKYREADELLLQAKKEDSFAKFLFDLFEKKGIWKQVLQNESFKPSCTEEEKHLLLTKFETYLQDGPQLLKRVINKKIKTKPFKSKK